MIGSISAPGVMVEARYQNRQLLDIDEGHRSKPIGSTLFVPAVSRRASKTRIMGTKEGIPHLERYNGGFCLKAIYANAVVAMWLLSYFHLKFRCALTN